MYRNKLPILYSKQIHTERAVPESLDRPDINTPGVVTFGQW